MSQTAYYVKLTKPSAKIFPFVLVANSTQIMTNGQNRYSAFQSKTAAKKTKNKPTRVCIPRSKRQASKGDACKLKQTRNKTTCACIPRYKRQTHIQMQSGEKQTYTCMYTLF